MQSCLTSPGRTLCALMLACTFAGCSSFKNPQPLPPLLDKATAGSGYASACPARNETERKLMAQSKLASSREVDMRLEREFPAGTDAALLSKYLAAQGFKPEAPCEGDASVQRASFFRKGVGFLPYDTSATVYWKVDAQQRIVWTKGFLFFIGL
ncbi:MAG TPA: hypothetical protein VMH83_03490 [Candidatus Acidoferrum sp.]|nr:hypothetical protein [Candidatus Acidoferrum sp.]